VKEEMIYLLLLARFPKSAAPSVQSSEANAIVVIGAAGLALVAALWLIAWLKGR
jgi:hypothetical protein